MKDNYLLLTGGTHAGKPITNMLRLGKATHTYLGHYNNLHKSGSLASVKTNLAMRRKKSLVTACLWHAPQPPFQCIPVKNTISPHCPLLYLPCWLTVWVNISFPGYLRQSLHNQSHHLYRCLQKLNTSLSLIQRYISSLCTWTQLPVIAAYSPPERYPLSSFWSLTSPSPIRQLGTARIHTSIKGITFLWVIQKTQY